MVASIALLKNRLVYVCTSYCELARQEVMSGQIFDFQSHDDENGAIRLLHILHYDISISCEPVTNSKLGNGIC